MKPEDLSSWQPQASTEQLADFIQQNRTLLTLLEEAWVKFSTTLPQPHAPHSQSSRYTEQVDWDTLEHFPITHAEMVHFLNHFERERQHNDCPFGDQIEVNIPDWTIQDDDKSHER